ncbi:MAG TPA: F0F1 ATP synthase subunit B [Candidatus Saccharimonadaceae bacterium]|nr:F0F1 ATP synthase subunit B [Candidatus Saccharimonadaceae bacterium]
MTNAFDTLAATANNNMFASLGIDWKMLILQGIAFLIFVYIMAKWVMPPLVKAVDDREKRIADATKAATSAEEKAQNAEVEIAKTLEQARKDAAEIVATARDEAAASIAKAQDKAKSDAELITKNAHAQIEKDVVAAREALQRDTIELVALATEKVVGKTVSGSVDKKLIEDSLKKSAGVAK